MAVVNHSTFFSTDTGAPANSTTVGSGITLLNALLRDGFNWQQFTASALTRSGIVLTLAITAHGFRQASQLNSQATLVPQRLIFCGLDQTDYNSDLMYPSTVAANSLTVATTSSQATTATSTGTSTLNGAIVSTSATTLTVTANASFPATGYFTVKVDSEVMLVTGGQGTNNWTVRRGYAGTTAATHLTAATIAMQPVVGVAPAGGFTPWTTDFTASNKSTYRPPAGNRMWLDADDTQASYFRVRGYENMTATGTGTGQFPTTAQIAVDASGACWARTSGSSRAYFIMACDRWVVLWSDYNNVGFFAGQGTATGDGFFGDLINQTRSGDQYATLLVAGNANGTAVTIRTCAALGAPCAGHYFPRSYTQGGTAVTAGKYCRDNRVATAAGSIGGGTLTVPCPVDGSIGFSPIDVGEANVNCTFRGSFPPLWQCSGTNNNFNGMDLIPGSGTYAGKIFISLFSFNTGGVFYEVSNTIQAT